MVIFHRFLYVYQRVPPFIASPEVTFFVGLPEGIPITIQNVIPFQSH